ncbi:MULTISPECIES: secondary thiamine-phosphate synthase enzyme YjbQ [Synechocystis]|uniref:YjbQ family protein n=1 Tax=Synechocystis salina LEGE 00031 TaxID=1828736 RepID=A0ABR9VWR9_9SYNC|nr:MULTISPECIES: secondary thiamine-phosphate synthase enzyme YjbQ [Synechocystis]MBE9197373.1 YjbQ family protein [Synechocystis sp. LEGE 06083]MBE9242968.1 YjbQ family protein [Synechocystis salina LEGE 00041]MBE9255809.1 YjbQ family protein [Synechocystis salina LEGE 00031]
MISSTSTFRQHQEILAIATQGKSLHNFTSKIQAVVQHSGVKTGLCTVFVRHTSASLIIQENADPDVLTDLAIFFSQLVPEDGRRYRHSTEGLDDMPAHIRSALTKTSEQIPIVNGRLGLGTWQGVFLWEHRQRPHQREVIVHVSGEV